MTRILRVATVVAALAFAGTAEAQFALDLKLAYAIPTGNVFTAAPFSDISSGGLPMEIAGRYRFTPNLSAGVYFGWGPTFIKSSACDSSGLSSCSASNMRVGIQAVYAFLPDGGFNPWVSLGTGWEWLFINSKMSGFTTDDITASGWEYFNVQAGVDFPLSKLFSLGPYLGYSGGCYSSASAFGMSEVVTSADRSFHGWFQIGAKGTFNL